MPNLYATVGVHPDYEDTPEPSVDDLVALAGAPRIVAIGETGLDYYRLTGDLEWQRERFRTHIRAARAAASRSSSTRARRPRTRSRSCATKRAGEAGGVMHCFTETWEVAAAALDLGFHISLSGIVTFKNANAVKDVARRVPLERLLIETDSPYLAPAPHRGRRNEPAYVPLVAAEIARLRGESVETIARATTDNFFRLFQHPFPLPMPMTTDRRRCLSHPRRRRSAALAVAALPMPARAQQALRGFHLRRRQRSRRTT